MPDTATPIVAYLDQNHWINLAKARVLHPGGASHRRALLAFSRAVSDGRLVLPLSAVHYAEIGRIKDVRQREDVALTMAQLSRFVTIADRSFLLRAQLKSAIETALGRMPETTTGPSLGCGVSHAVNSPTPFLELTDDQARAAWSQHGKGAIARIEDIVGGGWTFDRLSEFKDPVDALKVAVHEGGEFAVLRGHTPKQLPGLRARGYRPEEFYGTVDRITERERGLSDRLRQEPVDRAKLNDIVVGRLIFWELAQPLQAVLGELGLQPDGFFDRGKDFLASVVLAMPTMKVEFALRYANWRNGSYMWKPNDIHDLAALGVALATCDWTVTERHASSVLARAHVPDVLGVNVTPTVDDLVDAL
jgi:hypothetical protein